MEILPWTLLMTATCPLFRCTMEGRMAVLSQLLQPRAVSSTENQPGTCCVEHTRTLCPEKQTQLDCGLLCQETLTQTEAHSAKRNSDS
ncbi:hypothetical protein JZ751_015176 [Albula glossodonta]|uniref:Uncharacterized protein n=1 Tax=Albula glossodonta TaxID=121402 RepID=A0A8T2NUP3_9TELE|nr:hypothetical protein JZ751_015176 [Albula glossodonta]